jgi:23S rRNA (uracil1939-C5)-methyltransferase
MDKNEIFETEIVDMTEDGEGIGKVDGFTVFIKDTVIGDRVEAKLIKNKKTYGYGRLMKVLSPSAFRVEPACPVAAPCGGCQLQAMSYEGQLKFKENRVRGHLERIGHFTDIPMEPIVGMEGEPLRYRNKAQFPVGKNKDGHIITGFYAGRTHSIIPVEDCQLGLPVNRQVTEIVTEFMEMYHIEPYNEETHKGLVRHILVRTGYRTGQVMVCLVINGTKLPRHEELVKRLLEAVPGLVSVSLNVNREKTNAILGRELINLYGPGYLEDMIGDVHFRISPLSFFQVNPIQTEKLYGKALDAYLRICERFGEEEEDEDVEVIFNAFLEISEILGLKMYHYGAMFGEDVRQKV